MKRMLWWWVFLLLVLVVVLKATGNGSLAWTVTQYVGFSVIGLVVLINMVAGYFEWKGRRHGDSTD